MRNPLRRRRGTGDDAQALPIPPEELRALTGGLGPEFFDNPTGAIVYPELPPNAYEAVFDFGCGCGRLARQLIQQDPTPKRYVGLDLHRGMIAWCTANLAPAAPQFEFVHHDVFNAGLNPSAPQERTFAPFPVGDGEFSLVLALSVFTHLVEDQIERYLGEVARVLRPDGLMHGTFFTMDKSDYPMLQDFQNALYINPIDPTNAVIVDRGWLDRQWADLGLKPVRIEAPRVRGFHWLVTLAKVESPLPAVPWPPDDADPGRIPPPPIPPDVEQLGFESGH